MRTLAVLDFLIGYGDISRRVRANKEMRKRGLGCRTQQLRPGRLGGGHRASW